MTAKVVNFLAKKREKELSEAKTFCVALGGYDGNSLLYGLLFAFPTKGRRKACETEVRKLLDKEAWKKRLKLAGMPHSILEPPTVSSRRRELIFQGWVENFNITNPPVEIVFVIEIIEEIVRKAGAVRLEKEDYFNRFGRRNKEDA